MPLPLLILILPVLELWLMIEIGSQVGALVVIGWLLAMIVLGMNLLRYLGASSMLRSAQNLRSGAEFPAQSLADNLFKALGAVLLIIPGFLSDFAALLCFVPFIRRLMFKRWLAKMAIKTATSGFYTSGFRPGHFHQDPFQNSDFAQGNVYEHQSSAHSKSPKSGVLIEQSPDASESSGSKNT
ncbi:FxsA family protein [Cellvibrio fontiphilus]|uniref:FxsA family protein n=1 Tax=Cellvibrio fontiphilus TaxID=1815559 RepID=A0ABV7FI57_9GAMM